MEAPQVAYKKVERNLQIFGNCEEQVQVTVCFFPETNDDLTELMKAYPSINRLQYERCQVEEFDAYYGDPMPIVTEFGQAKKPVMIQNIWIL